MMRFKKIIKMMQNVSIMSFVILLAYFGVGVGQHFMRQLIGFRFEQTHTAVADSSDQQKRYEDLGFFNRVLGTIEKNYVLPEKAENHLLILGAVKGMVETLDPHSSFLSPELYKDMQVDTSGKFGGLGIEIGLKDNVLTILAPIEDTPAWKAGLKPNDRILKINHEHTRGMNLVEAVAKMRGKPHTKVSISIYREGFDKIKDIEIVRDIIKIQSVKYELLESQYGYLRLTTFNESAAQDVKKAIETMSKKENLLGLVLDLRMNPGGLLDQAVDVTSLFIDDGVIVSTIGRDRNQKDVKYARKGVAYKNFHVVVLVNSSTASAAEIVAGALQDHHRAIIMGQPTFGKGSVQTVIPLGSDMGLKLTIAHYYTPSGRSIQEKGVQPDVLLEEYDAKLLAQAKIKPDFIFREKDLKGHMPNPDNKGEGANSDEDAELKEFKIAELSRLDRDSKSAKSKENASKDHKDGKEEEDPMFPYRLNPKEDYQVKQALLVLKSFGIFKKSDAATATP